MNSVTEFLRFVFKGELPNRRVYRVQREVPDVDRPIEIGLQKVKDILIGTRIELVEQSTKLRSVDGALGRGKLIYIYVKVGTYKAEPQYNLKTDAGTMTKLSPDAWVWVTDPQAQDS